MQARVRVGYPYTIDAYRLHPVVGCSLYIASQPPRGSLGQLACCPLLVSLSSCSFLHRTLGGFVDLLMCLGFRPCPQQGLYSSCGPTYTDWILPGSCRAFLASSAQPRAVDSDHVVGTVAGPGC
jgi:hypothetical protein